MKKNLYKFILAIGIIIGCNPYQILGQCVSSFNNPSGTINVSPMVQTIVSMAMYQDEYAVINIATAGEYQVNTSFATELNVTDNSNVSLALGNNALSVNFPTAGLYRIHVTPFGCSFFNNFSDRIVAISPRNRAFNFDGTNDFIDCGIAVTNSLKGKDKLTVEAWVYPTQNTVGKSILGNHQSNTQFNIQQANDKYSFFIGFGSYAVTTAANSVVLNTWQHIAGVFDDNILKFYINGVLSGTTAVPSTYVLNSSCNTNVWIGKSAFGGEEFQGSIDEVRIWDRAVCQGEIQKNMNGIIPTTATNLLANYHFEHGVIGGNNSTVTTLVDYSGNGNNGTVTSAALNGATSNWVASAAYPANGSFPLVDVAPAYVAPSVSISGATAICNGASTTFTASGNVSTYNWLSGPTTATNTVSPTTTTSYSVVGTNSLGCLSNTATITLTVNSLPTISVNSGSICSGSSFTMVPSGASTYTFSGGSSVVSPTANTSYTVTGTSASGCASSTGAVSSVTVNSLPVVSVNSGTICSGTSFTMTPSGALTYTYTGGSAVVSPTNTTSYSVTGTNANGCVSTPAVSNVTVNVCSVGAALNFDGANDYVDCGIGVTNALKGKDKFTVEAWVYPTQNTVGKSIIGNHQSNTQFNIQQTDKYIFFIGFGSYAVTTTANSVVLNTWQHIAGVFDDNILKFYINGVLSGTTAVPTSYVLNPSCNTNVWIGKSAFGGEEFKGSIDEVRIWDLARTQCEINTYKNCEIPTTATNLIANYHFNQGVDGGTNTSVTTLTDASASAFTGTLTNMALTGATSNWVAPGGVTSGFVTPANLAPTVGTTVSNSVICNGGSTTLSGTGANTYVWTNGVINATAFSPTVTASYMVTGTNTLSGCTNTAVSTVTVNALPTISVNSGAICAGESFTMVPSGADTYTYSNGSSVATPTADATYSVSGTDANGCVSNVDAVSSVTVNALPVIVSESGSVTVCGDATGTFSISATNAAQYDWGYSNGGSTTMIDGSYGETGYTTTVMQIPTLQTEGWNGYDITCLLTSVDGCTVVSSPKLITVNQLPNITVNSGTICAGESFTMVPSGADTYTYSNGTDVVMPTADATYTVSGTETLTGCSNSVESSVTVNALPTVMATTNNTLLCTGETATLSVTGADTYTWSTTENTMDIAVSPTVQTTYTVDGTDANGCVNTTTIMQDVSLCTGFATIANTTVAINLYPNPTTGLFSLELTTTSKVTVTNSLGQVVITETFEAGKHNLDIQSEARGVYFVKVIENNRQQTIKVVKQ